MGIRHSPRTPYAPWTNGLVENQNRNLGSHLRLFLHNTPGKWSTQVHMYAYVHNSQPLSELNSSPYEIVFHTIPRIPINFNSISKEIHIEIVLLNIVKNYHFIHTMTNQI